MEAGADNVQFRLGERTLHSQYKPIVELGRIVATIPVDHERTGRYAGVPGGDANPGSTAPGRRDASKEKIAPTPAYIATSPTKALRLPGWSPHFGLAEIPVEDADSLSPFQPSDSALLFRLYWRPVLSRLKRTPPHRRLSDVVNAGLPRQVLIGNLRDHGHRAPSGSNGRAPAARRDATMSARMAPALAKSKSTSAGSMAIYPSSSRRRKSSVLIAIKLVNEHSAQGAETSINCATCSWMSFGT